MAIRNAGGAGAKPRDDSMGVHLFEWTATERPGLSEHTFRFVGAHLGSTARGGYDACLSNGYVCPEIDHHHDRSLDRAGRMSEQYGLCVGRQRAPNNTCCAEPQSAVASCGELAT